jgi:hypothetical protein
VKPTERSTDIPSPQTGCLGKLRGLRGGGGRGESSACPRLAVLGVALCFVLLAPAGASAHFVRPFVRQIAGTPTGSEGSIVPFGALGEIAVDGEGDLWLLDGGSGIEEFGPSGGYEQTLEPPSLNGSEYLAVGSVGKLFVSSDHLTGNTTYQQVEIFSKAGVLEKTFNPTYKASVSHQALASDPSRGDLYVYGGYTQGFLKKFNAVGEAEDWESFKGSESCECSVSGNEIVFASGGEGGAVAVDPASGDIWVSDGRQVVFEFGPGGEFIREVTGEEAPGIVPGGHGFYGEEIGGISGLAVDPSNGDLLVSLGAGVDEFDSEGVFVGQIAEAAGRPFNTFGGKNLGGVGGLAVDSHGDLYVSDHLRHGESGGAAGVVDEFGAGHFVPGLRPAAATQRRRSSAVLNGVVDPESDQDPEREGSAREGITDCHFEYTSEAAFKADDVNAVQEVTLEGASGGVFSLSLEGESTAATGTGDLVGPASGTGALVAGVDAVIGSVASSGEFLAGDEISGSGIPAGTTIVAAEPGVLVLSAAATASGSSVALSAVSREVSGVSATTGAFTVGEELSGAGIPAGTTITRVRPGRLTMSAAATASGSGVAFSAALAAGAGAGAVQSALEGLPAVGAGNVTVSGAAGGPFTVEFKGGLAHTEVAQLSGDASGLTPAGASVTVTMTARGGDGWAGATSAPCEHPDAGEIPRSDAETPVHALVSQHVEAGVSYRYRLVAAIGGKLGGSVESAPAVFTAADTPRISATAVSDVTSSFARFSGNVDPLGADTTYQFQYLPEAQFKANGESFVGAAVAPAVPADVGSGGEAGDLSEAVSEQVGGLVPATTYRFRLVASNEAGVSEGENGEGGGGEVAYAFTTQPAVSAGLPDGRAYELVTPPNKEGAEDMFQENDGTDSSGNGVGFASGSGDEFLFYTRAGFGPFPASAGNLYRFSRHPVQGHPDREEWSYASLASPTLGVQSLELGAVEPASFSTVALDDTVGADSSEVGIAPTSLLGAPGGPYTTLHADQPTHGNLAATPKERTKVLGASRDLGVVVLSSTNPALAQGGVCEHDFCASHPITNLYEWSGGQLSELDVKSDGEPIGSCGAMLGAGNTFEYQESAEDGAVSADGSKVFFTAPLIRQDGFDESKALEGLKGCRKVNGGVVENPPQLYMRSGEETIEVSAPEEGAPETTAHFEALFLGAAKDGSRVFFASEGELTTNARGIHDMELYEYDTENGKLTRVSAGDSGDAAGGVIAFGEGAIGIVTEFTHDVLVSSDGSYVYFVARGALAPANAEGESPSEGEDNLYVYDTRTGHTTFITKGPGQTTASNNPLYPPETTADGRYLLFQRAMLAPGSFKQLYRYDSVTERLVCVSCVLGAPPPEIGFPSSIGDVAEHSFPARAISEDGSVFFNTRASLVPRDTNGVTDVYEWHEGQISLISSGQDPLPSFFLGASANGANVFFGTHARLVPADSSGGGNVYDARVCTAAEPCIAPPPAQEGLCEGDACSHPAAAPSDATPASATFAGAGDLTPTLSTAPTARSCVKPKKLSNGRCVKAKPKRKPKKLKGRKTRAKRAASADKGGRRS